MGPAEERSEELLDRVLRQRAHEANDDLRMAYSLRVLSDAPQRRRGPTRRSAGVLAATLAAVAAVVVLVLGSHLASLPAPSSGGASPPASSDPAPRLLAEAEANLRDAPSYHLVASALTCNAGSQGGVGHARVDADVAVLSNGDLLGIAAVSGTPTAPTFEVIRAAGHLYVRGTALWEAVDPASASRYGDRWVDISAATNGVAGVGPHAPTALGSVACSLDGVPSVVDRFLKDARQDVRVGDTTYQGRPAITLREPGASAAAPTSIVLAGPPALPAVLVGSAQLRTSIYGERANSLTFDRVGIPVTIRPPADAVPVG